MAPATLASKKAALTHVAWPTPLANVCQQPNRFQAAVAHLLSLHRYCAALVASLHGALETTCAHAESQGVGISPAGRLVKLPRPLMPREASGSAMRLALRLSLLAGCGSPSASQGKGKVDVCPNLPLQGGQMRDQAQQLVPRWHCLPVRVSRSGITPRS